MPTVSTGRIIPSTISTGRPKVGYLIPAYIIDSLGNRIIDSLGNYITGLTPLLGTIYTPRTPI